MSRQFTSHHITVLTLLTQLLVLLKVGVDPFLLIAILTCISRSLLGRTASNMYNFC